MKKIISYSCFVFVLMASFSAVTHADIIPPNSHLLDRCVTIVNVGDFPDTYVIGYITGPTLQGHEAYIIKADECLNIGYKFNSLKILTVKKAYADTQGIDRIDPSDTNVSVFSGSLVSPYGGYMDDTNPLIKERIEYTIASISHGITHLYISKKVSEYSDGTPTKTESFSGSMTEKSKFPDVSPAHENFDAIRYVYDAGIVQGYPDGTYRPSSLITRAEFIKILIGSQFSKADMDDCLVQKANPDTVNTGKIGSFPVVPFASFLDVPSGYWAAKYVCVAQRTGIVIGYPDGSYRPDTTISFIEAAKIIINAFGEPMESNSVWYRPYVNFLSQKYAIPVSIQSFNQKITRGEMAEMIWRLKNNIATKPSKTYLDLAR